MLKKSYTVITAIAILDLGLNYKAEGFEQRYNVLSDLDTNKDGRIEEGEKVGAGERLHEIAKKLGAGTHPKSLCLDFSKGGETAKDDKVLFLNIGDIIYPSISQLSFELIHFLIDHGIVVESNFISKIKLGEGIEDEVQTDLDIDKKYKGAYTFVKSVIGYISKMPFAAALRLDLIISLLTFLENNGGINFIDSDDKIETAKKIEGELNG